MAHDPYPVGQLVQVSCRSLNGIWVAAQVVSPLRDGCVTVEFEFPSGQRARKTVPPNSQDLRSSMATPPPSSQSSSSPFPSMPFSPPTPSCPAAKPSTSRSSASREVRTSRSSHRFLADRSAQAAEITTISNVISWQSPVADEASHSSSASRKPREEDDGQKTEGEDLESGVAFLEVENDHPAVVATLDNKFVAAESEILQRCRGYWVAENGETAQIAGDVVYFGNGLKAMIRPDGEDAIFWESAGRSGTAVLRVGEADISDDEDASTLPLELELNGTTWRLVGHKPPTTPRSKRSRAAQSAILEDGTYLPGDQGMVELRKRNALQLFKKHPDLKQKFEADPASWKFNSESMLGFCDVLKDGFRARFSREILLLDRSEDRFLHELVESVRAQMVSMEGRPTTGKLRFLAKAVSEVLGGPATRGQKIQELFATIVGKLPKDAPVDFPIGYLFAGAPGAETGCGVCRHRALLFKYLCDTFDVAPCAVLTGVLAPPDLEKIKRSNFSEGDKVEDHMWNVVKVDNRRFIVDCMAAGDALLPRDHLRGKEKGNMAYKRIGGRAGLVSLATRQFGEGLLP